MPGLWWRVVPMTKKPERFDLLMGLMDSPHAGEAHAAFDVVLRHRDENVWPGFADLRFLWRCDAPHERCTIHQEESAAPKAPHRPTETTYQAFQTADDHFGPSSDRVKSAENSKAEAELEAIVNALIHLDANNPHWSHAARTLLRGMLAEAIDFEAASKMVGG